MRASSGSVLCLLLSLRVAPCCAAHAELVPYSRAPGDAPRADLTVHVNGVPIDTVSTEMNVGHAHFAFSGVVKVEIIANHDRGRVSAFVVTPAPRHRPHAFDVISIPLGFDLEGPRVIDLEAVIVMPAEDGGVSPRCNKGLKDEPGMSVTFRRQDGRRNHLDVPDLGVVDRSPVSCINVQEIHGHGLDADIRGPLFATALYQPYKLHGDIGEDRHRHQRPQAKAEKSHALPLVSFRR
jgi:hypothetical protein